MGTLNDRKRVLPSCREDCPAGIDVPRYIRHIRHGDFGGALRVIRETVPFPAVCGYACVHPCEARCARIQFDETIAIRLLKRAAWELSTGTEAVPRVSGPTGKSVAIIGSGSCGLTAAYFLALLGHAVEVFERDTLAGGMLRSAIPEYRLPEEALENDLGLIFGLGVRFAGGRDVCVAELAGRYDAVLIASGNQLSKRLAVPGFELPGVHRGLDFLRAVRKGEKIAVGEKVCVIGGGNAAADAARSSLRLGAKIVRIVCLERPGEMPAYPWEVAEAVEEGIAIENGWGPKAVYGKGNRAAGVVCVRCVSVFDETGRFNPRYDLSATRTFDADTVVFAIGQSPDAAFVDVPGVGAHGEGFIDVDEGLMTNAPGVFAAGEAVTGASSIIHAIAGGRRAAVSIDRFLGGEGTIDRAGEDGSCSAICEPSPRGAPRRRAAVADPQERIAGFLPVETGYSAEMAVEEASRCLACDVRQFIVEVDPLVCKECGYCREVCSLNVFAVSDAFNPGGYRPVAAIGPERCVGCLKCLYICPDFALSIRNSDRINTDVRSG